MPTNEPYAGTQSVLRAIALLKSFTDERPELGLAELAELVGLNKTTAFRLLTALESEGLIGRGVNDSYRLGPEAIALGGRAIRANNLRAISRPELEVLAQQTGETATLEVLSEGKVLTLDEVTGSHLVGASPTVGSHWPLHASSPGKVLLAYMPQADREAVLPRSLAPLTPKTITEPAALQQELARIRAQGYAIGDEELELSYTSISMPLFNHEGRVIAALCIGGPSPRLTPARIAEFVEVVKQAAARISAQLGYK